MDSGAEMQWSFIPCMTDHSACPAVVVQGKLFVVEGEDGKKCLSSCEALPSANTVSPFYTKLIEGDDRNIHFKINELIPMVEDVHQLKYLYTFVKSSHRLGYIDKGECGQYIKSALEQVSTSTTSIDTFVVFKLVISKAIEDRFICTYTKYFLEQEAKITHTSHAPFVKDLWKHINANTERIEELETRVNRLETRTERLEAFCEDYHLSLVQLQRSIMYNHRVESVTGMMGALINAISFGAMGSATSDAMKRAMYCIVDFGDLSHIKDVVNNIRDLEVSHAFDHALATVEKFDEVLCQGANEGNTILKETLYAQLVAAANDGNPLMAVVVTAHIMNNTYTNVTNCPPQNRTNIIDRVRLLEEDLSLENVPSIIHQRIENLELNVFNEIHSGTLAERVTALEEELQLN